MMSPFYKNPAQPVYPARVKLQTHMAALIAVVIALILCESVQSYMDISNSALRTLARTHRLWGAPTPTADEITGWDQANKDLFLRNYWQKRPVMIRKAFDASELMVPSRMELLDLSVDDDVESRLLQFNEKTEKWKKTSGPFERGFLSTLRKEDIWTILVQEVDRHVPAVADIWQNFGFIPDWRRDDIMISYATSGGGIGAHVDNYDVFLIQGKGQRDWSIENSFLTHNAEMVREVKGSPTRLLRDFKANQMWRLDAGDMLYLPPRVPHRGVSCGQDCTTISMGFRAPTYRSMMVALTAHICQHSIDENFHYTDPDLVEHGGGNVDTVSEKARGSMASTLQGLFEEGISGPSFDQWVGKYLTEPLRMHIRAPTPFFLEESREGKAMEGEEDSDDYDDGYDDEDDELPLAVSSRYAVASNIVYPDAESVLEAAVAGEIELRLFEGVRVAYLPGIRTLFLNGVAFPLPEEAEPLAPVLSLTASENRNRQINHGSFVNALERAGGMKGGRLCQSPAVRLLCGILRSGYYYPVDVGRK